MNAILVFDPSNDLLFVKSNQQFRSRLLKYARLNGLLAAAAPSRHWTPLASSTGSTSPEERSSGSARRAPTAGAAAAAAAAALDDRSSNLAHCNRPNAPSKSPSISAARTNSSRPAEVSDDVSRRGATRARHRTRKRTRQFQRAASKPDLRRTADDTSKCFTDILMLLLTPYVASLRLSNDLRGQQSDAYAELRPRRPPANATATKQSQRAGQRGRANNAEQQVGRHQAQRAAHDYATTNENEAGDELLAKFMSSISINHECRANEQLAADSPAGSPGSDPIGRHVVGGPRGGAEWPPAPPMGSSDEDREHSQRKGFSTLQMPVNCLKDCQVVYCQLFDFIFIYMQELASVSSFKLRLLQKRIDLFARLTLLLFGRALNSLRLSNATSTARRQTQLLRRAYDCWFSNQFQADLFLEANERLVLGSHIGQLCGETLRKVSAELRERQAASQQSGPAAETQQHALLFSDSKLVARFSCFNANPLTHEDLILLLILLKAFNADHNNELPSVAGDDGADADQEADEERARQNTLPKFHYKSHYQADRHTSQIRAPNSAASNSLCACMLRGRRRGRSQCCEQSGAEMPHQLAVFLAASECCGPDAQVYVPHMLRFVVLARGVTLILISEISTAYLNGQLSRVHSLLLDFNRHSLAESDRPGAGLDENDNEQQRHSCRQLRLSQVARLTDCISAIKSYFFAPRLAELLAHSSAAPPPPPPPQTSADQLHQIGRRSGEPKRTQSLLASLFGKHFAKRQGDGQGDCNTPEQSHVDNLERRVADGEGDCDCRNESEGAQGGPRTPAGRQRAWRMVERLGLAEQRLCRHLLRKLAELAQNNVQTYMRQTFGMALDGHKREALLSAVSATVRQSFSELVLEPQLVRLAGQSAHAHEYLRELSDQHDRVKLLARSELNDYLDYLAVKAQCNVPLGAPLTHGMSSITGFIYIDRARQELLISPMSASRCASMSWAELIEGDFEASIERQRRHEAARVSSLDEHEDGHSSEISSDACQDLGSSDDEFALDERGEEADQSESSDADQTEGPISHKHQAADSSEATTSDSIESIIYTGPEVLGKQQELDDRQRLWTRVPLGETAPLGHHRRARRHLGTSQDISAAGSSSASSQQSMQMLAASDHSASGFFGQRAVSSERHLDRAHLMARLEATCANEQQKERRLGGANEQLVQAFSAFIYNRLAGGQTGSFSQNCDQSQLSYFMWLKRQTVSSEAFVGGGDDTKL